MLNEAAFDYFIGVNVDSELSNDLKEYLEETLKITDY